MKTTRLLKDDGWSASDRCRGFVANSACACLAASRASVDVGSLRGSRSKQRIKDMYGVGTLYMPAPCEVAAGKFLPWSMNIRGNVI